MIPIVAETKSKSTNIDQKDYPLNCNKTRTIVKAFTKLSWQLGSFCPLKNTSEMFSFSNACDQIYSALIPKTTDIKLLQLKNKFHQLMPHYF